MSTSEKIKYYFLSLFFILIILSSGCSKKTCIRCHGRGYISGSQFSMIDKNGDKTYYEFAIPCARCNQKEYKSYEIEEIEIDKLVYN